MSKDLHHINKFIGFAAKELGLTSLPKIHLVGHEEDKKDAFGDFKDGNVHVRVVGRHPVDVMRTIAHELIHHKQNTTRSKKGEQMKEDDANRIAGRVMRSFDTKHPEVFKDSPLPEDVASAIPANCMGASSSTHGTGGIDTFDPLMKMKKISRLSDIIGKNKPLKNIKKGK